MNDMGAEDWPRDIFEALGAEGVRQVAYVPDAGHQELILRCAAARAVSMQPSACSRRWPATARAGRAMPSTRVSSRPCSTRWMPSPGRPPVRTDGL